MNVASVISERKTKGTNFDFQKTEKHEVIIAKTPVKCIYNIVFCSSLLTEIAKIH